MKIEKVESDYYDVIIVGAGIAGLECAKNLGGSGLNVLIIERSEIIGGKVCAGGIISSDLKYIPKDFINFDLQKIIIHYRNKEVDFPTNDGIISTIDRVGLLNHELGYLKNFKNVNVLMGVSVSKIISDSSLEISSGRKLRFKFLVGADGATSLVRRYLSLPIEKIEIAIQYIIPKRFPDFKIYLDYKLFGTGYLWIFPHKDHTSIGCGSDLRFIKPKELRDHFYLWLRQNKIDISGAKLEAALINYDYRGYKFQNIFLIGDAAGLTSGILGKEIHAAFLSGRQVARDILRENNSSNLIKDWLQSKRKQEKYMFFLKNLFLRKFSLSAGMILLAFEKFQKKAIEILGW